MTVPTLDDVRRIFADVRVAGDGSLLVCCPCHKDRTPSLNFWVNEDGKLAHDCKGGCDWQTVHAELVSRGLYAANGNGDRSDDPTIYKVKDTGERLPIVEFYDYFTVGGAYAYTIGRTARNDVGEKQFPIWRRKPEGGYEMGRAKVAPVLYHAREVDATAKAGGIVGVAEGEKDVHTLERLGLVATTNPNGAGKWRDGYSAQLRGAGLVVIFPDNDEPGRKHAAQVAASLERAGVPHTIVDLPGLPDKGDVSDWAAAGGTAGALFEIVGRARDGLNTEEPAESLPIYSVPDLLAMHIPEPDYLVGLPVGLVRGTVGELDAYPKCGKTRFTLDMCWSILHSTSFLDAPSKRAKVLYLTEEWLITWRQALADSHLLAEPGDGFSWMSLITAQQRGLTDWPEFCERLRVYCVSHEVGVLPVDTVARWAGVEDENDGPMMAAAIMPLRKIAAEGVAVLVLRHDRKGGGLLGESGRGSSAATGEVDYVLHLQKKAGSGETTARQREFEGVSRLSGETGKLIVELNDSGHYELVGARGDVMVQRAKEYVQAKLPADEVEAWTLKELAANFTGSDATLTRALNEMCRDGEVTSLRRAGHAARSKSSQTLGYWQGSARSQEGFDLDGE